ncbi:MAG: hypothetical protein QG657_5213, partial [Acidobacteriota bacterium]|nr:hypothetical protein [Acidobacteriota bacterium]
HAFEEMEEFAVPNLEGGEYYQAVNIISIVYHLLLFDQRTILPVFQQVIQVDIIVEIS